MNREPTDRVLKNLDGFVKKYLPTQRGVVGSFLNRPISIDWHEVESELQRSKLRYAWLLPQKWRNKTISEQERFAEYVLSFAIVDTGRLESTRRDARWREGSGRWPLLIRGHMYQILYDPASGAQGNLRLFYDGILARRLDVNTSKLDEILRLRHAPLPPSTTGGQEREEALRLQLRALKTSLFDQQIRATARTLVMEQIFSVRGTLAAAAEEVIYITQEAAIKARYSRNSTT
jgi:hypothetical protein